VLRYQHTAAIVLVMEQYAATASRMLCFAANIKAQRLRGAMSADNYARTVDNASVPEAIHP